MKKSFHFFYCLLLIAHSSFGQEYFTTDMKVNTHTFDYVQAIPVDPGDIYWDNQFGPTALSGNGDLPVYASAVNGNDLFLAGDFLYAGGLVVNHVVKWDGVQWSTLGTGMNDRVTALTVHNGILYASGDCQQESIFTSFRRIELLKQKKW